MMPDLNRLYAAHARSRDVFCIGITDADDEEPFSAILAYDAGYPQPWRRDDVHRLIASITDHTDLLNRKAAFVALSTEGDVYTLEENVRRERIVGAGFDSTDAVGLGSLNAVAQVGGVPHAVGMASQVYRRAPEGWRWLGAQRPQPEATYSDLSFRALAGSGLNDIYVVGTASPTSDSRPLTEAEWAEIDRLTASSRQDDAMRIFKGAEGSGRTDEGRAFHWNGDGWRQLDVPTANPFRDVYVETPERVWIVGTFGTILFGNARTGFQPLGRSDEEHLVSFTCFRDSHVCASDYALHTFDGHLLKPLKPQLRRGGTPTPLRVQAVDDVLFYFDYKLGVHRFDGDRWEEIPIPPELRTRDFRGLAGRRP